MDYYNTDCYVAVGDYYDPNSYVAVRLKSDIEKPYSDDFQNSLRILECALHDFRKAVRRECRSTAQKSVSK